jgi:hypothetical protein
MAAPTYSVTLHHLAPGAKAAGLGYADEQLPAVTPPQLVEMLHALGEVALGLTIYEPSSPEIRIKTDREVVVIRTRYRRLCFVGRETQLRGEDHSVTMIMAVVSGVAEPEIVPVVPAAKTSSTSPVGSRSFSPPSGGIPEWVKLAVLVVLSLAAAGTGVWMLTKPPKNLAPRFQLLAAAESSALLARTAGEYRTGTQPGDRRLVLGADGTLRIAKYGPAQAITEEIIRTARGASQNGQPGLATNDPYLMLIKDADSVVLYGQTYKRVAP